MNKEWSRREFVKSGLATAASLGLVGLLYRGQARAEGYGDYGSGGAETPKVNRIKDPSNLSLAEKKHSPLIEVEGPVRAGEPVRVTVRVGRSEHPMETKHWIKWIELYAGEERIARADLEPVLSRPVVTFTVVLPPAATLRAREECNLHGVWEETLQL